MAVAYQLYRAMAFVVSMIVGIAAGLWFWGWASGGVRAESSVHLPRINAITVAPTKKRQEDVVSIPEPRLAIVDRQHDAWRFAHDALVQGGIAGAIEAQNAAESCLRLIEVDEQLAVFVSGGSADIPGSITPEQQLAYSALRTRCAGFLGAGREASLAFISRAQGVLAANDREGYFVGSVDSVGEKQVAALLESGAPSAMAEGALMVFPYWSNALGISAEDPRAEAITQAIGLAICDLGRDCSATSDAALGACVYEAVCTGMGVVNQTRTGTEQNSALIDEYRRQFYQAVMRHDWASLGLNAFGRERERIGADSSVSPDDRVRNSPFATCTPNPC